jgi:hypothetical protein
MFLFCPLFCLLTVHPQYHLARRAIALVRAYHVDRHNGHKQQLVAMASVTKLNRFFRQCWVNQRPVSCCCISRHTGSSFDDPGPALQLIISGASPRTSTARGRPPPLFSCYLDRSVGSWLNMFLYIWPCYPEIPPLGGDGKFARVSTLLASQLASCHMRYGNSKLNLQRAGEAPG